MSPPACRSAFMAISRSFAAKPNIFTRKASAFRPFSSPPLSSPTSPVCSAFRMVAAFDGVESMMPLHSAIASARLISNIAVDSSCWSWLSRDFAVPR